MSETFNVALVAEGVTDFEVLRSAVQSMLGDQSFDLKLLQPESSVAFEGHGSAGPFGGGWRGVYRWCGQSADRAEGKVSNDPLFLHYDLLVVHLDADVAAEDPANDAFHPIPELKGVLPCEEPCPPPNATTDKLRAAITAWLGENPLPENVVLCTPSKSTEAWVVAMLFPNDSQLLKTGWECYENPEARLGQQKKAVRIAKDRASYEARSAELTAKWQLILDDISEAKRFNDDFLGAYASI